jgi:hypothetical protein
MVLPTAPPVPVGDFQRMPTSTLPLLSRQLAAVLYPPVRKNRHAPDHPTGPTPFRTAHCRFRNAFEALARIRHSLQMFISREHTVGIVQQQTCVLARNTVLSAPALAACHVHAPLVLLNWSVALWAGFSVGQDPVEVLTLSAVLSDPLADSATRNLHASTDRDNTRARLTTTAKAPRGHNLVALGSWLTCPLVRAAAVAGCLGTVTQLCGCCCLRTTVRWLVSLRGAPPPFLLAAAVFVSERPCAGLSHCTVQCCHPSCWPGHAEGAASYYCCPARTGRCASSLQLKQNVAPHAHITSIGSSGARSTQHSTAFSQLAPAATQILQILMQIPHGGKDTEHKHINENKTNIHYASAVGACISRRNSNSTSVGHPGRRANTTLSGVLINTAA